MSEPTCEVARFTDRGKVRRTNEDCCEFRQRTPQGATLLVVADGMAQRSGGEVASKLAVEAVLATFDSASVAPGIAGGQQALHAAFREAHRRILERVGEVPELTGMGTTLVAAVLDREGVTFLHAGDSRLYWLRQGQVLRVTRDHSVTQVLIDLGRLRPADAGAHSMAGKLTSYLGDRLSWENVQLSPTPVEGLSFQPEAGDVVLLCTDGVHTELSDPELAALACARGSAQERVARIARAVLERPARDNLTLVLALVSQARSRDLP